MAADSSAIEQAVSRTLRDNLGRIQRSSEELHQAVSDLVAACASSRPANALPPMIRAHTSVASLSAALEVLSRFVTSAMQPAVRSSLEQEISRATSLIAEELATSIVQPAAAPAHLNEQSNWAEQSHSAEESHRAVPAPVNQMPTAAQKPSIAETPVVAEAPVIAQAPAVPYVAPVIVAPVIETAAIADIPPAKGPELLSEPVPVFVHESVPVQVPELDPFVEPELHRETEMAEAEHIFSLDLLPPEEQELHRRAYRLAKVSMQDIKMLHPDDVRLGRKNRDLCFRLREDIEKAHKEYDRRFQSIQSHPVDYFYDWMVEILGGGDPQTLGEYPYPSPVLRR